MDFINENDYQLATKSENPEEKCSICECLMNAKGVTFCYAFEQSLAKNKPRFHPKKNYNCKLFHGTADYYEDRYKRTGCEPPDGIGYGMSIIYYEEALVKGVDPNTYPAYQSALKENNDYYEEQEIDNALAREMRGMDNDEFAEHDLILKNASKEEKSKILKRLREKDEGREKDEDWDDPGSYASCGDWEDEPENCFDCADDECPMNKG